MSMAVPMTTDFGMPCSNESRGRLWRSPVCDWGAGLTFDERERAARSARPSARIMRKRPQATAAKARREARCQRRPRVDAERLLLPDEREAGAKEHRCEAAVACKSGEGESSVSARTLEAIDAQPAV